MEPHRPVSSVYSFVMSEHRSRERSACSWAVSTRKRQICLDFSP
ncbi:hypothetical protein HMPREF9946_00783 [Acetobacteraceae bacterium AT-5844]|nr:hypothetical protein HMPREF9946_00783 [Acetobacteraceae bacterium AT-5844]